MNTPRNTWLGTGTSLLQPYPCRCRERRGEVCSPVWCPCAGRLDVWNFAPDCCAWWNTPAVAAAAQAAERVARGWR